MPCKTKNEASGCVKASHWNSNHNRENRKQSDYKTNIGDFDRRVIRRNILDFDVMRACLLFFLYSKKNTRFHEIPLRKLPKKVRVKCKIRVVSVV